MIKKNKIGFTLIELLVVIAIIGVLSSIAVINLSSAKNKVKKSTAINQISSLFPVVYFCLDSQKDLKCSNSLGGSNDNCDYDNPNPPNNGLDQGPVEICNEVNSFWPNIEQYGFEYLLVEHDIPSRNWDIYITTPEASGCWYVSCNEQGCVDSDSCLPVPE